MEFEIRYTNKEITPLSGMMCLKQIWQEMGFRELIEQNPICGNRFQSKLCPNHALFKSNAEFGIKYEVKFEYLYYRD